MKSEKRKLSNYQIKQLYEDFAKKVYEEGITAKYSWFLYKNYQILGNAYAAIANEVFDERREPDFQNMLNDQNELVLKYADRDEQANIKRDERGNPVINDNIVEFNKENDQLLSTKYAALYEKLQNKEKFNHEILTRQVDIDLLVLDVSEFPPTTPPYIVGLLGC